MRLRLLAVVVIPDVPMLRLMKFMVLKEKFLRCSLRSIRLSSLSRGIVSVTLVLRAKKRKDQDVATHHQ